MECNCVNGTPSYSWRRCAALGTTSVQCRAAAAVSELLSITFYNTPVSADPLVHKWDLILAENKVVKLMADLTHHCNSWGISILVVVHSNTKLCFMIYKCNEFDDVRLSNYRYCRYISSGTLLWRSKLRLSIMLLQATIIRNYFVKTQTYVASFGPPDLSITRSLQMDSDWFLQNSDPFLTTFRGNFPLFSDQSWRNFLPWVTNCCQQCINTHRSLWMLLINWNHLLFGTTTTII